MSEHSMIEWDVFISHASEDKVAVARPLADILAAMGVASWLDEAELSMGDSLREKIDQGLRHSQFGVVILSPSFFAKHWTRSELDGLIARESVAAKVVLPVWHKVTLEVVKNYSPMLAGRLAANTDVGLEEVARKILQVVKSAKRSKPSARPIYGGKLTKKVLMDLPSGSVLITNGVRPDMTPEFVEELGGEESRLRLWVRLRDAGVAGSKIYVFEDMAHLRVHLISRHDWTPEGI